MSSAVIKPIPGGIINTLADVAAGKQISHFSQGEQVDAITYLAELSPNPEDVFSKFPDPIAQIARVQFDNQVRIAKKIDAMGQTLRILSNSVYEDLGAPVKCHLDNLKFQSKATAGEVDDLDIYRYLRKSDFPIGCFQQNDLLALQSADVIFACLGELHKRGKGSSMTYDDLKRFINQDHNSFQLVTMSRLFDQEFAKYIEHAKWVVGLA